MNAMMPTVLNSPKGCSSKWWDGVWQAYCYSANGLIDDAYRLFEDADLDLSDDCCLNPGLSLARHNTGIEYHGSVRPVPPTENKVVSCFLPPKIEPTEAGKLVGAPTEESMAKAAGFEGDDRQHVMFLSTGRCGTVSLFRLFQDSNLEPYHTYWFMQHPYRRWEYLCRLFSGVRGGNMPDREWADSRRAEWLGEKPMIGLNHSDTAYAPVFAATHPNSRFVYLRRDPDAVFNSFTRKGQWRGGANHFRPVMYDFDGEYRFSLPDVDEDDGIRWHINYTEAFCRTFGRVMGDRFIEISADKLFSQDREEIAKLLEFVGSDIDIDNAVDHFGTKINEKAHKIA